jgi:hypothetical protein
VSEFARFWRVSTRIWRLLPFILNCAMVERQSQTPTCDRSLSHWEMMGCGRFLTGTGGDLEPGLRFLTLSCNLILQSVKSILAIYAPVAECCTRNSTSKLLLALQVLILWSSSLQPSFHLIINGIGLLSSGVVLGPRSPARFGAMWCQWFKHAIVP